MDQPAEMSGSSVAAFAPVRQDGAQARGLIAVAYALLLVVPSAIALVGPLKSNGSFVRLVGLVSFFLVAAAFVRWRKAVAVRPVALLALVYLALQIMNWAAAHRRGLDASAAAERDRTLLIAVSAVGIVVLCAMVVSRLSQAHRLVGLLVAGAAFSAVIGLLQFAGVMGRWAPLLVSPLTTAVAEKGAITSRGDLIRVSGAAGHPIEYAVCLAMVLPLAIHLLLHAETRRARTWSGVACGAILVGFPLGVSRAGLLTLVVALVVYGAFLQRAQRAVLLLAVVTAVGLAMVAAPDVVDTFSQSITGAEQDNSITGRLDDYPLALARIGEAPWLGGAPADVRVLRTVLDNQWLETLIESGVLGVVTMLTLFVGAIAMAWTRARRRGAAAAERSLHAAIAAAVTGAALAAGTFDLFSFQQVTFLIFLLSALIGVRSVPDRARTLGQVSARPSSTMP